MITLSYGAGLNTMGLLAYCLEYAVRPDYILFSDTGGEKPATYEHMKLVDTWLLQHNFPPITRLRRVARRHKSLEDECLNNKTLPSMAFGWHSCSHKWKVLPQERFFNNLSAAQELWARGEKITKLIGFDAGEKRRVEKSKSEQHKYEYRYPLYELGWFREDCRAACERIGLPIPPKSACFFCPASKKTEVIELARTEPDLFARCVAMERNAKPNLTVVKGLGRHWSWEELVILDQQKQNALCETVEQNCVCFDDGEED